MHGLSQVQAHQSTGGDSGSGTSASPASSSATAPNPTPQASSSSSSQCSGATDRDGCEATTGCSWGIAPELSVSPVRTSVENTPFCMESDSCDGFTNETNCESDYKPCMWYADGVTSPHCTVHVPRTCGFLNESQCKAYHHGCSYGTVNLYLTNGTLSNEALPVCMNHEVCMTNADEGEYRCCGEFTETNCDTPNNPCEWDSVTSRCIGMHGAGALSRMQISMQ